MYGRRVCLSLFVVCWLIQAVGALGFEVFFEEDFDGPDLNPNLVDGGFTIADGVIRRTGAVHGSDRCYVRTTASDYINRDFTYELTVNTTPISYSGINFMGIGEGVGSGYHNAPHYSIYFQVCSSNLLNGRVDVFKRTEGSGELDFGSGVTIGYVPVDGSHRLRMEKVGNQLTFSLDALYAGVFTPDMTYTIPDVASYAPFLNETNSRLHFGTAVTEHSFDDLMIVGGSPEPSVASFASTLDVDYEIDFGTFNQGDFATPEAFGIWNLADPASGADLDLVNVTGSGDTGVLTTTLSPFTDLAPESYRLYTASMDTSTAGDFVATYALSFSDELGTDQLLTLNLSGSVVPEPSALVLLGMGVLGLLAYAWRRRRREKHRNAPAGRSA